LFLYLSLLLPHNKLIINLLFKDLYTLKYILKYMFKVLMNLQ